MAGQSHYELPLPTFDDPVKALIVVAPYYKDIADQQLEGARAMLEAAGAAHETVEVPGALEVPTAIRIAYRQSNFDGFVALGCVIRGETTHYDTVCNDSSRALQLLGLEGRADGIHVHRIADNELGIDRPRLKILPVFKIGAEAEQALAVMEVTPPVTSGYGSASTTRDILMHMCDASMHENDGQDRRLAAFHHRGPARGARRGDGAVRRGRGDYGGR